MNADIIAQEQRCMFRIFAVHGDGGQHVAGAFDHGQAVVDHVGGQRVFGAFDGVVHVDQRHILIRTGFEGQGQRVVSEVVRLRGVVDHVLDSVDLGFQRRCDRVRDHLGARAGVRGHHHDGRRRHLRIFRNRQFVDAEDSRQHQEQRDHQRKPRTSDKNC